MGEKRAAYCGTVDGYQRHRAHGERACLDCAEAYVIGRAGQRPATLVVEIPKSAEHPLQYAAALRGREVADALTPSDRARLVAALHARGWTDVQIAQHTRMTTFTTAEIRGRLGLLPNTPSDATSTRGVA